MFVIPLQPPETARQAFVDWATFAAAAATACTFIAGAVGVYFRFFKGRVFEPRARTEVDAQFVAAEGRAGILVTTVLVNDGQRRIHLPPEEQWLEVRVFDATTWSLIDEPDAPWAAGNASTHAVFMNDDGEQDHEVVDSGERIQSTSLVLFPDEWGPVVACKVRLAVNGYRSTRGRGAANGWCWMADTIAVRQLEPYDEAA